MYSEPEYGQAPAPADSPGYSLLGCAAGILAGLLGGGLLLLLVSLALAVISPLPAAAKAEATPAVRLTLDETTLNKFAQNTAEGAVQLDILPGNQVNMKAETTISAFGVTVPAQITGLFGLQITPQSSVEVRLIKAEVPGFDLSPEVINGLFSSPLAALNQNLNGMVAKASTQLGLPLQLSGLGTTDTELWLEARAP